MARRPNAQFCGQTAVNPDSILGETLVVRCMGLVHRCDLGRGKGERGFQLFILPRPVGKAPQLRVQYQAGEQHEAEFGACSRPGP